jgi:hypothetical protein
VTGIDYKVHVHYFCKFTHGAPILFSQGEPQFYNNGNLNFTLTMEASIVFSQSVIFKKKQNKKKTASILFSQR